MEANDLKIYQELRHKLPYGKTPEDTARRLQIWKLIDVNSNGLLSLAEIDKGLRDVLCIPELFHTKPVIMRAFMLAKTKLPGHGTHGHDYVNRAEFRFLLYYLRMYYEYWLAFQQIDTTHQRRVSLAEFKAAQPLLKKWGLHVQDPQATFKSIVHHANHMLFGDFCHWAIQQHLALDGDKTVYE